MSPDVDDPLERGEAGESLKKVKAHLAKDDDQLDQLGQHIQEAERKRKQTFDPSGDAAAGPVVSQLGSSAAARDQVDNATQGARRPSRWTWFLLLGVLLVVLGIAGVAAVVFNFAFVVVFGPLLLASSLFQFVTALFAEDKREKVLHFVAAGLELVLGCFIMAFPPERAVGLIVLIAVLLIAAGLARLVRSMATRSRSRAWFMLTGLVAVLLGIAIWVGGSVGKLSFVGLCIAVDFLCHGVSWSAHAWRERTEAGPLPH